MSDLGLGGVRVREQGGSSWPHARWRWPRCWPRSRFHWGAAAYHQAWWRRAAKTPFLVYTDPDNPGVSADTGAFTMTTGGGLLGEYTGDGRFAGYSIDGTQDASVNTATGMAQVRGAVTATSPDGGSSFDVLYTGRVDFGAGMATGYFTASGGTGKNAGYTASGTIEGMVVGPATLDGADIGLC